MDHSLFESTKQNIFTFLVICFLEMFHNMMLIYNAYTVAEFNISAHESNKD